MVGLRPMPEPVSLVSAFDDLPDPRRSQGLDHRLTDLLVIAVGTLRVGGKSAYDMEDFGCAGGLAAHVPALARRHRQPRHLQPAVPRAGPGRFCRDLRPLGPSSPHGRRASVVASTALALS